MPFPMKFLVQAYYLKKNPAEEQNSFYSVSRIHKLKRLDNQQITSNYGIFLEFLEMICIDINYLIV